MASRSPLGPLAARSPATPVRRQQPAEQWLCFALAQQSRVAPHPDPEALNGSSICMPLRLRLACLESLPLFQGEHSNFEVRAGLTLFDGSTAGGCFFGNTVFSAPVAYDMRKSKGKRGFHVDLDADIFFHTCVPLAGDLSAVVEVVLVQRTDDGIIEAEYSAGWAQLPLQLLAQGQLVSHLARGSSSGYASAPSSPLRSPTKRGLGAPSVFSSPGASVQYEGQEGLCSVPVYVGSPRYLLLKQAFPEQAYPPQQLTADGAECRLYFMLETFPGMRAWLPLVPENFLLSYADVVPGVQRLDAESGLPTQRFLGTTSLLLEARLASVHAVVMCDLQLQLPDGFLEVVRKVLLGGGSPNSPGASKPGGYGGSAARLPLPLRELQNCLRLRAAVHNGRTFVGPTVWGKPGTLEVADGQRGAHRITLTEQLPLAWVPGDVCVAVVLELLLVQGDADAENPSSSSATVLSWGVAAPFSRVSGDGAALVAEGPKQIAMKSGPGHWVRHVPVLDWRRLLEKTNRISPDPPLACFTLREAVGQGIWPPPLSPVNLVLSRSPSLQMRQESLQPESLPYRQPSARSTPRHSRAPSVVQLTGPADKAAPVPNQSHVSSQPSRAFSGGGEIQGQRSSLSVASEAETMHTLRDGSTSRGTVKGKVMASQANVGNYKAIASAETIQAWQINARPATTMCQQGQDWQQADQTYASGAVSLMLPPVKTRTPDGQLEEWSGTVKAKTLTALRTKGDEEAVFAGSPSVQYSAGVTGAAFTLRPSPFGQEARADLAGSDWWYPGSSGRLRVRLTDVAALAATATPLTQALDRKISLAAELEDPLGTNGVTLQLLGYAPAHGVSMESLGGGIASDSILTPAADGNGGRIHFTFRLFTNQPTVTPAAQVLLLPATGGGGAASGRLCALVAPTATESLGYDGKSAFVAAGSAGSPTLAAGIPVTLSLQPPEQVELQLSQLAAQGLGEDCRSSVVRQLRLRAAQYLAERWLQVDVWDSTSLLQVGTFAVPLRGLLRQGQETVEVVYQCPLLDQAQALLQDTEPTVLDSAPLKGSVILRLINRGCKGILDLDQPEAMAGSSATMAASQPATPAGRQQQGQQAVARVIRAKPALDVAGEIAQDLAGLSLASTPSRSLKEEIIQKAQQKVQRILHYRHAAARPGGEGDGKDVGRLVHDQLLADIEQARDRCKPDIILRKLQQELPASVAVCAGPGEAIGLEREFVNPSHEEGLFEVTSTAPGELVLVADGQEWQALTQISGLAGLLSQGDGNAPRHIITTPHFRVGPRQRALLRFRLQSPASGLKGDNPRCIHVSISRVNEDRIAATMQRHLLATSTQHDRQQQQPRSPNVRFAAAGPFAEQQPISSVAPTAAVASFKVVALPQPHIVDRTLRLYHPAASSQVSQTVLFGRLPAARRLESGSLRLACHAGLTLSIIRGPSPHQPVGVRLSCAAPAVSSTICYHLSALTAASPSPQETWEVYLHCLPCVEMTAVVGESVTTVKEVAAPAGEPLQLSCHGLCRDELEFAPREVDLHPGTQGRIQLIYTPQQPTKRDALVSVVDDARQRPLEMLLVRLDSTATRVSRNFEVTVDTGKTTSKKVSYTNPYQQRRSFAFRTNKPGLLRFGKAELEMGPGATAQVRMTFDASGGSSTSGGTHELLVFVDDLAQSRVAECFRVTLRII